MSLLIDIPRETQDLLEALTRIVLEEAQRQNLISAATAEQFEQRHLADSLQLLPLCPAGVLVDIGSGGGFPGMVLACARPDRIHLVEPRTRRADFLHTLAERLDLSDRVTVHQSKVQAVHLTPVAAITARAVATLDALFAMALHLADRTTVWVLPKGRSVKTELEAARATWQGSFELIPSMTDPDAAIVRAARVSRRRP